MDRRWCWRSTNACDNSGMDLLNTTEFFRIRRALPRAGRPISLGGIES